MEEVPLVEIRIERNGVLKVALRLVQSAGAGMRLAARGVGRRERRIEHQGPVAIGASRLGSDGGAVIDVQVALGLGDAGEGLGRSGVELGGGQEQAARPFLGPPRAVPRNTSS